MILGGGLVYDILNTVRIILLKSESPVSTVLECLKLALQFVNIKSIHEGSVFDLKHVFSLIRFERSNTFIKSTIIITWLQIEIPNYNDICVVHHVMIQYDFHMFKKEISTLRGRAIYSQ